MEIKARVALSLPNQFYKVELKYDTFEKATFDSYLIASLVKNSKSEEQAMNYIDSITGNGSLNGHFKNLYKEISKLSKDQIEGILNDSLFPVTVVDTKNHFKYYPMFDVTRMNGKVYKGNLANYPNLSDMLMPQDKGIKFRGIEFKDEPGTVKEDMYNAVFSDEEIKVDLDGGNYCPISKEDFWSVFKQEKVDVSSSLMPKIGSKISDGNWSVLTNPIVSSWKNNQFSYMDEDGNLSILTNEFIKTVEVINVFDLLFYKETRYQFSKSNQRRVESAVDYLINSGSINTCKTKTLIMMLCIINDIKAQKIVDYVLSRKDSKEMSEMGFKLIKNGLEKGWRHETLLAIKKYVPASETLTLYMIDRDLDFTIDDFLNISDEYLREDHLKEKRDFLSKRESMLQSIRAWIGEMAEIREKAKKLQKNSVTLAFNDFANKYIGHSKIKFDELPMEKLEKEFNYVKDVYNGIYQKVKASLEKLDS